MSFRSHSPITMLTALTGTRREMTSKHGTGTDRSGIGWAKKLTQSHGSTQLFRLDVEALGEKKEKEQ